MRFQAGIGLTLRGFVIVVTAMIGVEDFICLLLSSFQIIIVLSSYHQIPKPIKFPKQLKLNIQITTLQKKMKIKQPIPFSSIIEYYTEQSTLRRPKQELIQELKDIGVLYQFLLNRIPSVMKNLKETAKEQQKCIKEISQNIRKSIDAVMKRKQEYFYLGTAYNVASSFPNTNLQVKPNSQIKPDIQMKLKFFESQNLPTDLIWQKPSKQFRQYPPKSRSISPTSSCQQPQSQSQPQKDYNYYSHFNNNTKMLEIVTRKYRIHIRLDIRNQEYVWVIDRIQLKINQEKVDWIYAYFMEKVLPAINHKFGPRAELNFLASVDRFSYCIQLMELNLRISQSQGLNRFTEKLVEKYRGQTLELTFTTPQSLLPPTVTITLAPQQSPSSSSSSSSSTPSSSSSSPFLTLSFTKRHSHLTLVLPNLIRLQSTQNFKYENPSSLLSYCVKLLDYAKKFIDFFTDYRSAKNIKGKLTIANGNQFKNFLFVRIGAVYWSSEKIDVGGLGLAKFLHEDGIYVGGLVLGKFLFCGIVSNGMLNSRLISKAFLTKLIKCVPSTQIFFKFMYIIQSILNENNKKQLQMDHYCLLNEQQTGRRKVQLYFRKRQFSQQLSVTQLNRPQSSDQDQFYSIKFAVDIFTTFDECHIFSFKDYEQLHRSSIEKPEWKPFLKVNGQLDPSKIVEFTKYYQDNLIFKYVIDRKMKMDSKAHYKINI